MVNKTSEALSLALSLPKMSGECQMFISVVLNHKVYSRIIDLVLPLDLNCTATGQLAVRKSNPCQLIGHHIFKSNHFRTSTYIKLTPYIRVVAQAIFYLTEYAY